MATITPIYALRYFIWHLHRYGDIAQKRLGRVGFIFSLVLMLVMLALLIAVIFQSNTIQSELSKPIASNSASVSDQPAALSAVQEIERFQAYLLPNEDVSEVLRLIIGLANREGLQLVRGEYKVVSDARGGFVRYKMTLPVQGGASKVEQFILNALAEHKTLALDSVQFKRERIDTSDVEARVEWVLMTRQPIKGAVAMEPKQ
jgi:hypothetical protein